MFAEFEKITHALVEAGEPLTVERFASEYRKLLELYFGPDFAIDDELALECLRIPHFYRAFYVYKYATGLSRRDRASRARAQRRQAGAERLPRASSRAAARKYPLDLLRGRRRRHGEARSRSTRRWRYFGELVEELDELL